MAQLEVLKGVFMMLDRRLQLFDVLGPPFSECCLSLPISLFTFLRRCIYLGLSTYVWSMVVYDYVLAFDHLFSFGFQDFPGEMLLPPATRAVNRSDPHQEALS